MSAVYTGGSSHGGTRSRMVHGMGPFQAPVVEPERRSSRGARSGFKHTEVAASGSYAELIRTRIEYTLA